MSLLVFEDVNMLNKLMLEYKSKIEDYQGKLEQVRIEKNKFLSSMGESMGKLVENGFVDEILTSEDYEEYASSIGPWAYDEEGRITWDNLYMIMARTVAERSGCKRLRVGCIITTPDHTQVLSLGYNGSYRGGPNTCLRPDEPGNCGCFIHAEVNAIAKCNNTKEKYFYITNIPCANCAALIVNSGALKVIVGSNSYRSTDGLNILADAKIPVILC